MAKDTWIELQPNDPIFSGKLEISVLQSKPSMTSSLPNTDGTKPESPLPDQMNEEQLATEWNSLRMERLRRLQVRPSSKDSPDQIPPL